MNTERPTVAVFDTKPYDEEFFRACSLSHEIDFRFFEFRLGKDSAHLAKGCGAACIFVNDDASRTPLEHLAAAGVRHVALRCAGFNNVDLDAADALGLTVTRVPSYSPYAVAEHTVALLLALNRKIHKAYARVRELNFSLAGLVGFDLFGKTAGIIGTGKTGKITAEILRGFRMQVLVYDPFPDPAWAAATGCSYVTMEELLAASDVISLHLPLTKETEWLINQRSLALCKRGVYLVNVSRGRLIDTTALIEGLKSGHIGGVALDVYEEEEGVFFEDLSGQVLQDDELARLLTFPNVLITSHQAFLTREALEQIAQVTQENILRLHRRSEPLQGTALTPKSTH